MGQEQSSNWRPPPASYSGDGGVHRVRESGTAVGPQASRDKVDELLENSRSLSLPQQLLPPPAVKDDMSSALQGATMMNELRSALGGLILGIEENYATKTEITRDVPATADGRDDAENSVEAEAESSNREIDVDLARKAFSIDEFSKLAEVDTRAEQDFWARLGINQASVDAMLEQCTGGARLASVLDCQARLMEIIVAVKDKAVRLRRAMDRNSEDARRTTKALERLDRINVALADVQENLESAVATANILGASHFAHDDEMCSFKNFLRHNPPNVP